MQHISRRPTCRSGAAQRRKAALLRSLGSILGFLRGLFSRVRLGGLGLGGRFSGSRCLLGFLGLGGLFLLSGLCLDALLSPLLHLLAELRLGGLYLLYLCLCLSEICSFPYNSFANVPSFNIHGYAPKRIVPPFLSIPI